MRVIWDQYVQLGFGYRDVLEEKCQQFGICRRQDQDDSFCMGSPYSRNLIFEGRHVVCCESGPLLHREAGDVYLNRVLTIVVPSLVQHLLSC